MAAPNIVNVSSILGKTAVVALSSTSQTTLLSNAASSDDVLKVNMIQVANVDGTNDATVDVQVVDTGGSPTAYIAKTMSVPADTSLELAGQSKLVLETGDKIQALASAASDIEIFVSYLEIT